MSKSLTEIQAAMRASREKGKGAEAALKSVAVGVGGTPKVGTKSSDHFENAGRDLSPVNLSGAMPTSFALDAILSIAQSHLPTALLDRLTHRSHTIETGKESYRITHATPTGQSGSRLDSKSSRGPDHEQRIPIETCRDARGKPLGW